MTVCAELAVRHAVGRAFSAAADYDEHARVQSEVAKKLADRIASIVLPPEARVLEIGCGTGLLTAALSARGLGGSWWITDLCPAMLERCRERMGARPAWHYVVLDGETGVRPDRGGFDLIVSSMAMQWFDDLPTAVRRLVGWLRPGGHLIFTTLGAGTFAEWRAAHQSEGLVAGTPELLSVDALRAILPDAQRAPHAVEQIVEGHASARTFLRGLRAIGATTAASGHRPLAAGDLRRVMKRFEQSGSRVTYEVVTCHYGVGGEPAMAARR